MLEYLLERMVVREVYCEANNINSRVNCVLNLKNRSKLGLNQNQ